MGLTRILPLKGFRAEGSSADLIFAAGSLAQKCQKVLLGFLEHMCFESLLCFQLVFRCEGSRAARQGQGTHGA